MQLRTIPLLMASFAVLFVVVEIILIEAPAKGPAKPGMPPLATRISAELGVSRYELERPPAGGLIGWAFDADGEPLARYAHPRADSRAPAGVGATGVLSTVSCDALLTSFLESGYLCHLTGADDPCAWADLFAFAWIRSCR
jgi:hypothetical protein